MSGLLGNVRENLQSDWLEVLVYQGGRGARLMVGSCLVLCPTVPGGFGEFGSCF